MIQSISAITLGTHDMARAVRFTGPSGSTSCTAAKLLRSPAFAPGRAIST